MDKNAIKKYAVWARQELIRRVTQKALQFGITADDNGDPEADRSGGYVFSDKEKKQRKALIFRIKDKDFEQVIEEVAYIWFNRFTAIRFMEVNGYLPSHVRVFTDAENNFKPQILAEAIDLEMNGLNMEKVYALKEANKNEELFKYLLIVQCNTLSEILPGMFQRIEDYTELLLPDYLLRDGSVIQQMIERIPEEDWTDQVQIIGWLYQYYNTELKDQIFADLKKNIKITKEKIPAATQLFTPDWIVRYMVENSLGRLWLEGHPNDSLKSEWKYYINEAKQDENVQEQLEKIHKEYASLTPEDIMCIDPCCGSGHILCYLFDILVQIYEDYGYTAREAVPQIIEKNLWGLDIDERAAQMAYFSVMMKAVQYDKRFLRREYIPQPNVYSPLDYADGEEFGSLIKVDELEFMPEEPKRFTWFDEVYETRLHRWKFRRVLAQKYHVVCTNPPYMATSNLVSEISHPLKIEYPDEKADLFACFIERCKQMMKNHGFQAMITQHSWMFLSTYEKVREKIKQIDIINLLHLGPRAFEEIGGEVVQTSSFVFRQSQILGYKGTYCRLIEPTTQQGKEDIFLAGENRYTAQQDNFSKIPGSPVAYWASEKARIAYKKQNLNIIAQPRHGLATSDNDRFLKLWYEVDFTKTSTINRCDFSKKWFPISKGGIFRKWYGNLEWLINYENDGKEIKDYAISIYKCSTRTIQNTQFYFREGLTWSALTSGGFSVRWQEKGALFGSGGYCAFAENDKLMYILALMNSKATGAFIQFVSPTLNYEVGHIKTIPVLMDRNKKPRIDMLVKNNINISREDWDSFETSWDFTRHPLLPSHDCKIYRSWDHGGKVYLNRETKNIPWSYLLEFAYENWEIQCEQRFNQLKANEEELNRIFIDIYGLNDELTPEVEDKDVTVRKADLGRDIRSFISYAVGCMMGRYSLDMDGLAYAGGEWEMSKYETFQPDKDAILPISDDEYFSDDIVNRFVEFVRIVYGDDTLEENLKFIADALGGKGNSRAVIRDYFINSFYAEHCKIYQKRPIYWLFDSGKKNGFKCLLYMHRYKPDTIARIRTEYVHEQQSRYNTAISDLEQRIDNASTSERVKLSKELSKLKDQETELRKYEEKIHHLADQMIQIDLDNGVKHNYEIFKDVLAQIK